MRERRDAPRASACHGEGLREGAAVEIRILGPVEVIAGGRTVSVGGSRSRALLAMLALRPNQLVAAEFIAAELWPGQPPDRAMPILHVRVAELRRALRGAGEHDRVVTRAPGYLLRVGDGEVDASRFAELVGQGRVLLAAGDATGACEQLDEALRMWRGPPLADLPDLGWASGAVTRLEEARLAATEWRTQAALATGGASELTAELAELTGEHPLRERLWGLRMLALYQAGRQAEALRIYQQARASLVRDLGVEPGAELRELHARILAQDPGLHPAPGRESSRSVTAVPAVSRAHLPTPRTSFVGRKADLDAISDLIGAGPLITLTGVGGCGKTRLALAVAAAVAHQFADGAVFADLGSLSDPDLVGQAIAMALRLEASEGTISEEAARAADREALIVLDNCEHLIAACAAYADVLMSRCPGLRILATSRQALGVDGEQVYLVPSLDIDTDAATLFVERARTSRPGLPADRPARDQITQICRRLDGIPLAIELAASRAGHLALGDILSRLDDRFTLLAGGDRRIPRHQTLTATMDWSHDLLADDERVLFRRLAVFCSPFSLAAAESVGSRAPVEQAQVLDLLASLIRQSLVTVVDAGADLRYRMLVTVRDYASQRLQAAGEVAQSRRAHLDYVLAAIAEIPTRPTQSNSLTAQQMRPVEIIEDDIRAAFEYALDIGDRASALGIAARYGRYAMIRTRHGDGLALAERALSGPPEPAELYGWTRYAAALLALAVDPGRSEQHAIELITFGHSIADRAMIAGGWHALGDVAYDHCDWEKARSNYSKALDFTEHSATAAVLRRSLADVALAEGDVATYLSWSQQAMAEIRRTGSVFEIARTAASVGAELAELADPSAGHLLAEALTLGTANGYNQCIALTLIGLARVAEEGGQPMHAATVLAAAEAHSERAGSSLEQYMFGFDRNERVASCKARLAGKLTSDELTQANLAGHSLTPAQAAEVAVPGLLEARSASSAPRAHP